ncbi:DUF2752 domain-containing protein [Mycobacterium sp.]|uniref:DUF2752 domain-containing protein n=1 Tax=Mycobacterium sp. TaxID=1785 RepID=UPI00127B5059|nr:DUF2752 domain-containing protein [Mycobacterium sp.]KAA8966324.1 MAG: DUF2752 domain-containing protein [Mycobacterium sp.]
MPIPRHSVAPLGAALGVVSACALVWWADPTTPGGVLPPCPTKLLLGIDCPGCGSLRMLYAVLHGDVAAAARFNALGLVVLVLLGWVYAGWAYGRLTRRRIWSWHRHRWAAPVTLLVVSGWLVVRNLPFGPFAALRV